MNTVSASRRSCEALDHAIKYDRCDGHCLDVALRNDKGCFDVLCSYNMNIKLFLNIKNALELIFKLFAPEVRHLGKDSALDSSLGSKALVHCTTFKLGMNLINILRTTRNLETSGMKQGCERGLANDKIYLVQIHKYFYLLDLYINCKCHDYNQNNFNINSKQRYKFT